MYKHLCGARYHEWSQCHRFTLARCNRRIFTASKSVYIDKVLMAYVRLWHTLARVHQDTRQRTTWNRVEHSRSTSRLPLININFIEKIVPNGSRNFGFDSECHCLFFFIPSPAILPLSLSLSWFSHFVILFVCGNIERVRNLVSVSILTRIITRLICMCVKVHIDSDNSYISHATLNGYEKIWIFQ